jgi:LmbE family N-acetylglucosaminyl deacetylase
MSRKIAGIARWAGLLGGRQSLAREVVVVSPHLDDAVLSLGAAISRATRQGASVTVLTVLAGDTESTAPAGGWDSRSGFVTQGEATAARRAEDERACAIVGARPVWLPYGDNQYERGGSDQEIRAAAVAAAGSGLVLLPGFPLAHVDHRRVHDLLAGSFGRDRVGFYAEQPYAAWDGGASGWRPLRAGLRDRRRKVEAIRAYATQLDLLEQPLKPILRYELRHGGETAALP